MVPLLISRTTLVWLVLVGATGLSWGLGHGIGALDGRLAGLAILVVAFLKVGIVILEFMEIRGAPVAMRLAAEAWLITICMTLVVLFLKASS